MNTHPKLHLIKLAVGPKNLADLAQYQASWRQRHQEPHFVHVTRNRPKRAAELEESSLYWIINGTICARQRLLDFRPLQTDTGPHCGLVLAAEIIRTAPRRHRPFQGWRYFDAEAAPVDLPSNAHDLSDDMLRELTTLGLLS